MQLKRYSNFPDDLKAEWDALLEKSSTNVPFLRFDYLKTWWQTNGGGEWQHIEPVIICARRQESLSGIAPMFFTRNHEDKAALMLLGSIEVSDYLDLLAAPQDIEEFVSDLLPFLRQTDMPAWQRIDWYNLPDSSPTLPALQKAAEKLGWSYQEEKYQPCPYVPLPGDWQTYLAGIDKKQRHEIRRKIRRLEEAEVPSRWYTLDAGADLEAEIEDFLSLMEQEGDKADFLTEEMRQHMRLTIRCFSDMGCLHLSFLEIDGKKAAAKLCFDYNNRLLAYNSGIERHFMDYSPGWVLLGYLLEWANQQKRTEFDFMRGGETYKYRFGAVERYVMRVTLAPADAG